jgi:hybrid cluster-associated redox disulfide protein
MKSAAQSRLARPAITSQTLVQELLTEWPALSRVFVRHRMACVGCALGNFDTLADAARNYSLPVQALLDEIYAYFE